MVLIRGDCVYLCLQWCDKFWKWSMHYDWKWQLFENAGICMEKLVKPHWSNLFSVGFTHLKPLCHRPCDQPCASRLLRTSAAAASTAAGASVSCAALAPVLSRLYALNLPESKYKQNYWRIFQEKKYIRLFWIQFYKWWVFFPTRNFLSFCNEVFW